MKSRYETKFALFIFVSIIVGLIGFASILFEGPSDNQWAWATAYGIAWLVLVYLGIDAIWEEQ